MSQVALSVVRDCFSSWLKYVCIEWSNVAFFFFLDVRKDLGRTWCMV